MTTLTDAIRGAIQYEMTGTHTAMPATFVSFDASDCSATVQPSVNKNYLDGTTSELPVIYKVPVLFPVAGQASITFPINPGDYCLLIICERSLEEWKRLGINEKPIDRRKFNLSDAVAIPGMVPFTETMPIIGNGITMRFGNSTITIGSNGQIQVNSGSQLVSITSGGDVNVVSNGTIRLNGNAIAIGNSFVPILGNVELINELQVMAQSMVLIATPPVSPFNPLLPIFTRLLAAMTAIKGTL